MKIWNNYGTEHSYNLVMIGEFENIKEAEKVKCAIERLESELPDLELNHDRYSDKVINLLRDVNCMSVSTQELEQFMYDHRLSIDQNKLVIETDEIDFSAYIKLMIDAGATIEIFRDQGNSGEEE